MNDYDFSTLNPDEFENLTIDLISRDRDKRFERFKAGRDGGIDGRYYGEDGKQEIIQCKHYLKTGYSGLISSLKKKNNEKNEADKVKLLNPKKYIFVTSLPLSAINKTEIKELFDPYIKNDSDIYGQEDLNDLLKSHPDIEENHYKLWISSTTVLQRIFNNAINGRSEFLLEEIKDKIKYYVITENHNKAIKKLEESHTIIIAGEPGIGKTTLAEQISLHYIEKEFEFCVIAKDISEAEAIFERDKKQIFYFDDFLGSNYLNALEAHTDSEIMRFITRVKKDKTKRFILTSRTNILNQSLSLSDKFRTKKLDSDEFIITVDELAEIDKGNILYNHIWHSNLSDEYIDELYKEERYKQIINHRNFNPRLIEFITDIDRISPSSVSHYWENIQKNLDNPSEIWANTFDRQSDDYIRNIVSLVVFNGNTIEENELKEAYSRLNNFMKIQYASHNSKEFESVIEETVQYFLTKVLTNNKIEYSLFNPSIADFIIHRYKENDEKLLLFLQALKNISSLQHFSSMNYYSTISQEMYQESIQQLYLGIDIYSEDIKYIIQLLSSLTLTKEIREKILPWCEKTIERIIKFNLIDSFIFKFMNILLFVNIDKSRIDNNEFLRAILNNIDYSELEDINKAIKLINDFNIKNLKYIDTLNEFIEEYLIIQLENRKEFFGQDPIYYENFDEEAKFDGYLIYLIEDINYFMGREICKEDIKWQFIDDFEERLIEIENKNNVDRYYEDQNINFKNKSIDDLFQRD